MPKVKLTEKDLRKIVEKLLTEADPAPAGDSSADDFNPKAVKITNDNTPGLDKQVTNLGTLLAQVSGTSEIPEGGYPSVDEMISNEGILAKYSDQTGIMYNVPYDPDDVTGSRINLVKTLLKYQIVLALQGKLPGQSQHRYAFFDTDAAYMRAQNDNWPTSDGAPTFTSLVSLKNTYYSAEKGAKVVSFGTKEFYDLLDKSEFVSKLVAQEPWFSPKDYAAGVYIHNDLQADVAVAARTQLAEIAEKIPKIYEQFDSDFVEEFFCVPLLMPNYWMSVKGPDDHPLYTPWRQTYVMLNILAQAMSIEGGIESLYLKFADFVISGPRRSTGTLQPASMDAYSTTVFKSLNESRKIMLTLRELRRIVNAAMLLKEAPKTGGLADLASGGKVVSAGAEGAGSLLQRGTKFVFNTSKEFVTALDGGSAQVRAALGDAVKIATTVAPARLARLEGLLGDSPRLAETFDEACNSIGTLVDDELIPANFWVTVGAGSAPQGGEAAADIIRAFLKARASALSNGSAAPAWEAIETVAKARAEGGGDLSAAADLIKGVIDRQGDLVLVTPNNLATIKRSIMNDVNRRTALEIQVNSVKGAIISRLLDNLNPITTTVQNTQFVTTFAFDEAANAIKHTTVQVGTATAPSTVIIDVANPGDSITSLMAQVSSVNIEKEVKADLLERLNEIRKAMQGRFKDDTDIATALIEQAATNNSQGVLRAAYAVAYDAGFTLTIAKEGLPIAQKGTFATAVTIADAQSIGQRLESLGIGLPTGLTNFIENSPILNLANKALKTSGFVPDLIGKALIEVSLYRLFSTTRYGRFFKWCRNKTWIPTILGLFVLRKASGAYVKSEAGTPGERATAEYPFVLSIAEIINECTHPGPYVNLLASVLDNFYYGGSAGTKEFVPGQEVTADNGLSAYGKVLGGAAGDLMKALKRYDSVLDASPTVFPNLLEQADEGGIQEKAEAAAGTIATFSRFAGDLFSFSGEKAGEADQVIKAAKEASSAVTYTIDAARSSQDATTGNQDWSNLEGARQTATQAIISALQARSSGSPLKDVSVVTYRDVLIQMISRQDERSFGNNVGLWLASFLTGVDDPAYYDLNIDIIKSGASGDDLMKLYAKNLKPTPAQADGGVDGGQPDVEPPNPDDFTPQEMENFYEATYGVSAQQYKALRDALTELSGKVRPQIFVQAASQPSADAAKKPQ